MTLQTKTLTYSQRFNQPLSFFEIISDKEQIKILIEDINTDKSINIEVERFIYQTSFYPELEAKLQFQRAELAKVDDYVERLKLNERIQDTETELKNYKIGILETSAILYDLKEESLTEVKRSFFSGNIVAANSLLNSTGLMQAQSLLLQKLEIEKELEEVYEKLVDNASEYLVKAELTSLNLEIKDPEDRVQKAIEFFEKGKVSAERSNRKKFKGHYFSDYGSFLRKNNFAIEAINVYDQSLKIFRDLAEPDSLYYQSIIANILNNLGNLHSNNSNIAQSEKEYTEALEIYKKLVQKKPYYQKSIALVLGNLGVLHSMKHELDFSEKAYLESLTILESPRSPQSQSYFGKIIKKIRSYIYGNNIQPDDLFVKTNILANLASLYFTRKEFGKSEEKGLEVLKNSRELAQINPKLYSPYLASALVHLGNLYYTKGNQGQAEANFKKALDIYRNLAENDPRIYWPKMADTLNHLGNLYLYKNELIKAEKDYAEALAIYRKITSGGSNLYLKELAQVLNNLAVLDRNKNDFNKAEQKYNEVLGIYEKLSLESPEGHLNLIGMILANLGNLYSNKKEWTLSEEKYLRSIEVFRQLVDVNSQMYKPELAQTLMNLGTLYKNKQEFEKAEKQYVEALAIYREMAKINPEVYTRFVAIALKNYASIYLIKNELELAEEKFLASIEIFEELKADNLYSGEHLKEIAETLNSLGIFYNRADKLDQSEQKLKEALNIYEKLSGINGQDAYLIQKSMILFNLAGVHARMDKLDLAEKEYEESLKIKRKLAKVNYKVYAENVANTLGKLAIIYSSKNAYTKAEKTNIEALSIFRKLYQADNQIYLPEIASILYNLARLYHRNQELNKAEKYFDDALLMSRQLVEREKSYQLPLVEVLNSFAFFYFENNRNKQKSLAFSMEGYINASSYLPAPKAVILCQQSIKIWQSWNEDLIKHLSKKKR